jgi:hypothetical protein
MVRYADDFVILARQGQGTQLMERLKKWLTHRGLKLNETKTRLVDLRREGIKFLGFELMGRQATRSEKWSPLVEPHPKSLQKLRDKIREKLNRGTLRRGLEEVIPELNRQLEGMEPLLSLWQQQLGLWTGQPLCARTPEPMVVEETWMPSWAMESAHGRISPGTTQALPAAPDGGVEASVSVEAMRRMTLGKPDAVTPPVRFDEGRSPRRAPTTTVGLIPLPRTSPTLLFPINGPSCHALQRHIKEFHGTLDAWELEI